MKKDKYIEIYLAIYRCSVIVTWESDIDKIIKTAKKRGVEISNNWKTSFIAHNERAVGVCMDLGDANNDVLVWLKKKPKVASDYGVLYHELYHAVDHLAAGHNLEGEREARAYLYEYISTHCNRILWPK